MPNENPTSQPAAGTIVNMGSGEKKDSMTGKSRGNKKREKAGYVTFEQIRQLLEEQSKKDAEMFITSSNVFAERIMKAAEQSGNKAFADVLRGSKPTTLLGKFKAHINRTVSYGDVYWIVAGGIVLAVMYNGAAYLFRNKVAFPFAREFRTGIAAERRAAGIGAVRPRVQMPSARA